MFFFFGLICYFFFLATSKVKIYFQIQNFRTSFEKISYIYRSQLEGTYLMSNCTEETASVKEDNLVELKPLTNPYVEFMRNMLFWLKHEIGGPFGVACDGQAELEESLMSAIQDAEAGVRRSSFYISYPKDKCRLTGDFMAALAKLPYDPHSDFKAGWLASIPPLVIDEKKRQPEKAAWHAVSCYHKASWHVYTSTHASANVLDVLDEVCVSRGDEIEIVGVTRYPVVDGRARVTPPFIASAAYPNTPLNIRVLEDGVSVRDVEVVLRGRNLRSIVHDCLRERRFEPFSVVLPNGKKILYDGDRLQALKVVKHDQ